MRPLDALRAHDPRLVAVGASAGAVQALLDLLPGLPATLPAPVLVVVHVPRDRKSALPALFAARCGVRVAEAEDKIDADAGTVYFAPAGYHLLVERDGRLALSSDEPVTLRLDVRGPAEITAGDIQTTADIEILNPDAHLATVNAKGRLAADLTIERGRGYLQADATRGSGTIGVIPVDSIFSPVRRVAFTVEPTRVEQSTNYDRLVLDIETDGSITPREALASSGATLRALVQLVEEMSDEPQGLEIGEVIVPAVSSPDLDLAIEDLDLSERPRNCLKRAQVNTVGELLQKSEDDLLAITNFGQKSLDEVLVKLDERGLSLRGRN